MLGELQNLHQFSLSYTLLPFVFAAIWILMPLGRVLVDDEGLDAGWDEDLLPLGRVMLLDDEEEGGCDEV